jgi:hypothetical protein
MITHARKPISARFSIPTLFLAVVCTAQGQYLPVSLDPPLKDWKASQFWISPTAISPISKSSTTVQASSGLAPLTYVAVTPCRLMDTRTSSGMTGDFGPPALVGDPSQTASVVRRVPVPKSPCGIPSAAAYSLNLVVVPPAGGTVGWLAAWPDDQPWPGTVVLNASAGGIVGNVAIVASGVDGGIQVSTTNPTDLVIDINGYYAPQPSIRFLGSWNASATYAPDDVVSSGGSSYIAITASQGVEPARDVATGAGHWAILAQGGSQGPPGAAGPIGPQGPVGPSGPPGAAGIAGLPGGSGPTGPTGPQGPPNMFRGAWNNATSYAAGDAVSFGGSSYVSLSGSNMGNSPSSGGPWAVLAQQGSPGTTGPAGPSGPSGPPGGVGSGGPAGPSGPSGPPGIAGSPGPAGPTGPVGPTGPTGPAGSGAVLQLFATISNAASQTVVFVAPMQAGSGSASESQSQVRLPAGCPSGVNSLSFDTSDPASLPPGQITTVTFRVNGSDSLSCSINPPGVTACSASGPSPPVPPNALIDFLVSGPGLVGHIWRISAICQ